MSKLDSQTFANIFLYPRKGPLSFGLPPFTPYYRLQEEYIPQNFAKFFEYQQRARNRHQYAGIYYGQASRHEYTIHV